MDIVLGAMNFRLNDLHKVKDSKTGKRSNRTISKDKLYKVIYSNITEIRPRFNVGINTGIDGDIKNYWKHFYRHWNFVSSYSHFDKSLTKKSIRKNKN